MVLAAWPDAAELCGYCDAPDMTPELVEALVRLTEEIIGEPLGHTVRKLFPQALDRSIRDEVVLAWEGRKGGPSRKGGLRLSNKLSSANHVQISAMRFPRPKGGAYPADWGQFSVRVRSSAPAALQVLTSLGRYAELAQTFFARADSPQWWDSLAQARAAHPKALALGRLRFASQRGWAISERLGWINCWGSRAAAELGLQQQDAAACAERVECTADGGRLLWLTAAPFDFGDEGHRSRHAALMNHLAPHRHDGD